MYTVSDKTIRAAYKPFDVVTNASGDVGFIKEVYVNNCQPEPHQISYAVHWLVGAESKTAWFDYNELTKHCNLFVEVAKCACHPFGNNAEHVDRLFEKIGTSCTKKKSRKKKLRK